MSNEARQEKYEEVVDYIDREIHPIVEYPIYSYLRDLVDALYDACESDETQEECLMPEENLFYDPFLD